MSESESEPVFRSQIFFAKVVYHDHILPLTYHVHVSTPLDVNFLRNRSNTAIIGQKTRFLGTNPIKQHYSWPESVSKSWNV